MEKMLVSAVLMDVDGTMTDVPAGGKAMSRGPLELLVSLVSEVHRVSAERAGEMIMACGDPDLCCLSGFLPRLGIDPEAYFEAVRGELAEHIVIPDDTAEFFAAMKKMGIPLSTATTNSPFMTRAKLAVGGLATRTECEYIAKYHSGNEFNDPKGKFSEHFFPNILKYHSYDPATTMMIGDEPERDLYPALKAGIRYGVIIRRSQKEPVLMENGGIFVRSFKDLGEYIQPVKRKEG